jgi:putative ABC transport system permease protein
MNDYRFALRQLRKTPGFTPIAAATLALGIGAHTAIFTIIHAAFLERLPSHDADRTVAVWETNARNPARSNVVAPANFLRWKERATVFESLAGYVETRANLTGNVNPEEVIRRSAPNEV